NWLYFWPLRLIAGLELAPDAERCAYRVYGEALERAHYGQALDLGLSVDALPQDELAAACRLVTELKTGEITALAMALGGVAGGVEAHVRLVAERALREAFTELAASLRLDAGDPALADLTALARRLTHAYG